MRPPNKLRPHFVYRLRDKAGRLLYVGMTWNLKVRMYEHARYGAAWFGAVETTEIEEFPDWGTARYAEREAIENERPAINFMDAVEHDEWKAAGLPLRRCAVESDTWFTAIRIAHTRGGSVNNVIRAALTQYVLDNAHILESASPGASAPTAEQQERTQP
jgi:predicted GIY-YIG superfamily endonuclease